jgi:hypothetical protein
MIQFCNFAQRVYDNKSMESRDFQDNKLSNKTSGIKSRETQFVKVELVFAISCVVQKPYFIWRLTIPKKIIVYFIISNVS